MVVLLYDPGSNAERRSHGQVHRLVVPKYSDHPIAKGIEHLFERDTLTKARDHKNAFIDIAEAHRKAVRGETRQASQATTNGEG